MKFHYKGFMGKFIFLVVVFVSILSNRAESEDNLENIIREMLKNDYPVTYVQSYMQPFATAFGTTMITGIYHRAYTKEFPHGDLGIKAIRIHIPDQDQFFIYENEKVPTVFGPVTNDSSHTTGTGLKKYTLPIYQLNFGMFSGFEVMIRGNKYTIPEIGTMEFWGLGVRYGMSDIIPMTIIPLDLSVQVIYHTYSMGDWLNSGTFAMNLQTSTDLKVIPVTIFGGIGYESTSLKLSTDKIPEIGSSAIGDISINGKNKLRATIGAGVTILLFNIHFEFNYGEYNSAAAGAMFVF